MLKPGTLHDANLCALFRTYDHEFHHVGNYIGIFRSASLLIVECVFSKLHTSVYKVLYKDQLAYVIFVGDEATYVH